MSNEASEITGWTFLSNHAHVLICIASEPEIRLRDVASRVGITERAVQRIVADLEAGDYLSRERVGRRNRYKVDADRPLRHPIESHGAVSKLLELVQQPAEGLSAVVGRPICLDVTPEVDNGETTGAP